MEPITTGLTVMGFKLASSALGKVVAAKAIAHGATVTSATIAHI